MKHYRVSIWATVDTEAGSKEIAEEIVRDMLANQEIKIREFDLEAEEN